MGQNARARHTASGAHRAENLLQLAFEVFQLLHVRGLRQCHGVPQRAVSPSCCARHIRRQRMLTQRAADVTRADATAADGSDANAMYLPS
jgi:hypothetical protein